jgi:hypothetical protein
MITIPVLQNNTLVSTNSISKFSTTIDLENYDFIIDYLIIFSNDGSIGLYLDNSTFPGFFEKSQRLNNYYIQKIDEISLSNTPNARLLDETTPNDSYFLLKDNLLKFISNDSNGKVASWSLPINTTDLFISNNLSQVPKFNFVYDKDILNVYFSQCNAGNIIQKLAPSTIQTSKKANQNRFISILFEFLNFNLSFENAYIFSGSTLNFAKASQVPNCSTCIL